MNTKNNGTWCRIAELNSITWRRKEDGATAVWLRAFAQLSIGNDKGHVKTILLEEGDGEAEVLQYISNSVPQLSLPETEEVYWIVYNDRNGCGVERGVIEEPPPHTYLGDDHVWTSIGIAKKSELFRTRNEALYHLIKNTI